MIDIIIIISIIIGIISIIILLWLLLSSGEINILSFLSYIRHQRACLVQVAAKQRYSISIIICFVFVLDIEDRFVFIHTYYDYHLFKSLSYILCL